MKKYKSHKELHIGDSLCTCYVEIHAGLNGTLFEKGPGSLIDLKSNRVPGYRIWTVKGNKNIPIYRN